MNATLVALVTVVAVAAALQPLPSALDGAPDARRWTPSPAFARPPNHAVHSRRFEAEAAGSTRTASATLVASESEHDEQVIDGQRVPRIPIAWRTKVLASTFSALWNASKSNNPSAPTSQDATNRRKSFIPSAAPNPRRLRVKGYLVPSPAFYECQAAGQLVVAIQSTRIRYVCQPGDVITDQVRQYTTNNLIPIVEQWVSQHLLKKPAEKATPLFVDRNLGICQEVLQFIPRRHVRGFGPGPIDAEPHFVLNSDASDSVPRNTSSASAFETGNDLVIYVTHMFSTYYMEARACQWHPDSNRPTVVHLNIGGASFTSHFGFGMLSTYQRNYVFHNYVLHEMTHALALSRYLYDLDPTYFSADSSASASPFTRRRRDEVLRAYQRPEGFFTAQMRLPEMQRVARRRFKCDARDDPIAFAQTGNQTAIDIGVDLEQTGDVSHVINSHYDVRTLAFELVAIDVSNYLVTNVTFALLESTGWYDVDYRHAFVDQNGFGAGAGCGFVTRRCNEGWQRSAPVFATVVNDSYIRFPVNGKLPPQAVAQATVRDTTLAALRGTRFSNASLRQNNFCFDVSDKFCSVDHVAVASCVIKRYSFNLPVTMQYFAGTLGPDVGGHTATADYCPLLLSYDHYCNHGPFNDAFCFDGAIARDVTVEYPPGTTDTVSYLTKRSGAAACLRVVNCDAVSRTYDVVDRNTPPYVTVATCTDTPRATKDDPYFGETDAPVFEHNDRLFVCPKFDVVCGGYTQQHTHLFPSEENPNGFSERHTYTDIVKTQFPSLNITYDEQADAADLRRWSEATSAPSNGFSLLERWRTFHHVSVLRNPECATESPKLGTVVIMRVRNVPFSVSFTLSLGDMVRYGALLVVHLPSNLQKCISYRVRSGPSASPTRSLIMTLEELAASRTSWNNTAGNVMPVKLSNRTLGFIFSNASMAFGDVLSTPTYYCDLVMPLREPSSNDGDDNVAIDNDDFLSTFAAFSGDPGTYPEISVQSLFARNSSFSEATGFYHDRMDPLIAALRRAANLSEPTPANDTTVAALREIVVNRGHGALPSELQAELLDGPLFFSDEVALRNNINPTTDDITSAVARFAVCVPSAQNVATTPASNVTFPLWTPSATPTTPWASLSHSASLAQLATDIMPAACRAVLTPGRHTFDARHYDVDNRVVELYFPDGADRGFAAINTTIGLSVDVGPVGGDAFSVVSVSLALNTAQYSIRSATSPSPLDQVIMLSNHFMLNNRLATATPASPPLRLNASASRCVSAVVGGNTSVRDGFVIVDVWILPNALSNGTIGTSTIQNQQVPYATMMGPTILVSLPAPDLRCASINVSVPGFFFRPIVSGALFTAAGSPESQSMQPPLDISRWNTTLRVPHIAATVAFSSMIWGDVPLNPSLSTLTRCYTVNFDRVLPLEFTATTDTVIRGPDDVQRYFVAMPLQGCPNCLTPFYFEVTLPLSSFALVSRRQSSFSERFVGIVSGDTFTISMPATDYARDYLIRRSSDAFDDVIVTGCAEGTVRGRARWTHQRVVISFDVAHTSVQPQFRDDAWELGVPVSPSALSGQFPWRPLCRPVGGRIGIFLSNFTNPSRTLDTGGYPSIQLQHWNRMQFSRTSLIRSQVDTFDTVLFARSLNPVDDDTGRSCTMCHNRGMCRPWSTCLCMVGFGGPTCDVCATASQGALIANSVLRGFTPQGDDFLSGCRYSCDLNPPPFFSRRAGDWSALCLAIGGVLNPQDGCRCYCNGTLCLVASRTATMSLPLMIPTASPPPTATSPPATTNAPTTPAQSPSPVSPSPPVSPSTLPTTHGPSAVPPPSGTPPAPTSTMPPLTIPPRPPTVTKTLTLPAAYSNAPPVYFAIGLDVRIERFLGNAVPLSRVVLQECLVKIAVGAVALLDPLVQAMITPEMFEILDACPRNTSECRQVLGEPPSTPSGIVVTFAAYNVPPSSGEWAAGYSDATAATQFGLVSAIAGADGQRDFRECVSVSLPMIAQSQIVVRTFATMPPAPTTAAPPAQTTSAPLPPPATATQPRPATGAPAPPPPPTTPVPPPPPPAARHPVPVVFTPLTFTSADVANDPTEILTRKVTTEDLRRGFGLRLSLNVVLSELPPALVDKRAYVFNATTVCAGRLPHLGDAMPAMPATPLARQLISEALNLEASIAVVQSVWCLPVAGSPQGTALFGEVVVESLIVRFEQIVTAAPMLAAVTVPIFTMPIYSQATAANNSGALALSALIVESPQTLVVLKGTAVAFSRSSRSELAGFSPSDSARFFYPQSALVPSSGPVQAAPIVVEVTVEPNPQVERSFEAVQKFHLAATIFSLCLSPWAKSHATLVAAVGFVAPRCSCLPNGAASDLLARGLGAGRVDWMGRVLGAPFALISAVAFPDSSRIEHVSRSDRPSTLNLNASTGGNATDENSGATELAVAPYTSAFLTFVITTKLTIVTIAVGVKLFYFYPMRRRLANAEASAAATLSGSASGPAQPPAQPPARWRRRAHDYLPLQCTYFGSAVLTLPGFVLGFMPHTVLFYFAVAGFATVSEYRELTGASTSSSVKLTDWDMSLFWGLMVFVIGHSIVFTLAPLVVAGLYMTSHRKLLETTPFIGYELIRRSRAGDRQVVFSEADEFSNASGRRASSNTGVVAGVSVDSSGAPVGPIRAAIESFTLSIYPAWLLPSGFWLTKDDMPLRVLTDGYATKRASIDPFVQQLFMHVTAIVLGLAGSSNSACDGGASAAPIITCEGLDSGLYAILILHSIFLLVRRPLRSRLQLAQGVLSLLGLALVILLGQRSHNAFLGGGLEAQRSGLFRTVIDRGGSHFSAADTEADATVSRFSTALIVFDIVAQILFPLLCALEALLEHTVWTRLELRLMDARDQRRHLEMFLLCPEDVGNELIAVGRPREFEPPASALLAMSGGEGIVSHQHHQHHQQQQRAELALAHRTLEDDLTVIFGGPNASAAAAATSKAAVVAVAPPSNPRPQTTRGDDAENDEPPQPAAHPPPAPTPPSAASVTRPRPPANRKDGGDDDDDDFWGVAKK